MRKAVGFRLNARQPGQRRYRPSENKAELLDASSSPEKNGDIDRKWSISGAGLPVIRLLNGMLMKSGTLKILIVCVAIPVIAWMTARHLDNTPSLGYQVSEAIEIGNPLGGSEYVQEITVHNPGRVMATAVSIKVPQSISSYQLKKHTNLVKEASVNNTDRFELLYPELPPDQRISLVVHYGGNPIPRDWITVFSNGSYVQPPGKMQRESSPFLLGFLFLSGFLISVLLQFRKQQQGEFFRQDDERQLLRDDKPWFATQEGWPNLQFSAIASRLSTLQSTEPAASFAFKVLSHEKPQLMRDEQWAEIRNLASDKLLTEIFRLSLQGASVDKLLQWAKLVKPGMLAWHDWQKYQRVVGERLVERMLPPDADDTDYDKVLAPDAPTLRGLPDALQELLRTAARKQYFNQLAIRATEATEDPLVVLEGAKLSYLNDEQKLRLQNHCEQLARMRSMPRSWDTPDLAAFVASGRPEWMPEAEFTAIGKLVSSLESLEDDREIVDLREQQARNSQAYADKLRKRALAQLGLIDRVLTNPEAVDTLEDYAESLEPSYQKSLERIAWLLRRSNRPANEKKTLTSVSSQRNSRKS